ncbi:hypothetical protein QUF72_22795 [Desulfobacterales bacterium HSG2]|nr:hypothetical protein [Desulfobacterales bacterium HSG2]
MKIGKMARKMLLSKIFGLDPKSKRIETLLSDPEIGEILLSFLDEIDILGKRVSAITEDIKKLCKFNPEDWNSVIEKTIRAETLKDELSEKRTRKRKKEIEDAVKIAIAEGMGPSDIRTIIEVMVMGMQPGNANYLLPEDGNQNIIMKPERVQKPKSSGGDFLKTAL